MSTRDDGTYPGKIVAAYVAEDQWDQGEFVLKLDVDLSGGGAVTCRQSLSSKKENKDKRDPVLRALELTHPVKHADLARLAGREIDVNLKTSAKGRQHAYVAAMREERVLSPEEVDALADDNVPF